MLPPSAIKGIVCLKLLEFGHSNDFFICVCTAVCLYVRAKEKKMPQMKIIFALDNRTLCAYAADVHLYSHP